MSFFSKLISKVYESVVQDEFYQQLTEHEVFSVINQERIPSDKPSRMLLQRLPSLGTEDVFKIIENISDNTPQLQFRMLGYEPGVEAISVRVAQLKKKLGVVEGHLLQNSDQYINKINLSLDQLQDMREFYSGRMKGQELRGIMNKLKMMLDYGKKITRLNIIVNNLKNTIKILQKIPNIKKMNLIELKTINWQSLQTMNLEFSKNSSSKLLCIDNLYAYTTKINNQEFIYIIDKIKQCFDCFDSAIYEEVIRNYSVISPNTTLEKLISSLLEQKLRSYFQVNIEQVQEVGRIGLKIIESITNLHKLIKWHRVNRATRCLSKNTTPSKNTVQQQQIRNRCLSVDSVLSQQSKTNIELTDLVLIDTYVVKNTFLKTIDSCLADLISDQLLVDELSLNKFYEYIYLLSRIAEICYNFTGIAFEKMKKVLTDYCSKRQFYLFNKNAKELISSLEFQKNEWNRLPFYNNYRSKPLDKFMFRAEKMKELEEFKKVEKSIQRLFQPVERDLSEVKLLLKQQQEEQEDCIWQLSVVKLPSFQKIDKSFEEWNPGPSYLTFNQGDSILCQSSFKMLSTLQKYFQFLLFVPRNEHYDTYISHLLIAIEFYMFYLFNTFLTSTYKHLFYEQYNPKNSIDRKYTKKRLLFLYPELSMFVSRFRGELEKTEASQQNRFYGVFRKDINQMKGENNQVLRAKVIATESCRFIIAYTEEMFKRLIPQQEYNNKGELWNRLKNSKVIINELSTILLTESSQKMVGLELETMRSLFQTIRWYQPLQELRDYFNRFAALIRESYQRLKSSNRGEIPLDIIYRIFVLIWRTLLTFGIKLFLEGKSNAKKESKLNFQKFLDEMYLQFNNTANKELAELQPAYIVFKSVFPVLLCTTWQSCKQTLLLTMKKYDYIFQILMALLQSCEYVQSLVEKQKELVKSELKNEIESILDDESNE